MEVFEDTKGVIRIRKLKKDRQHWPKEKKTKGQTAIYKTLHITTYFNPPKKSLAPPLFIAVPVPFQESEQSCIYVY